MPFLLLTNTGRGRAKAWRRTVWERRKQSLLQGITSVAANSPEANSTQNCNGMNDRKLPLLRCLRYVTAALLHTRGASPTNKRTGRLVIATRASAYGGSSRVARTGNVYRCDGAKRLSERQQGPGLPCYECQCTPPGSGQNEKRKQLCAPRSDEEVRNWKALLTFYVPSQAADKAAPVCPDLCHQLQRLFTLQGSWSA